MNVSVQLLSIILRFATQFGSKLFAHVESRDVSRVIKMASLYVPSSYVVPSELKASVHSAQHVSVCLIDLNCTVT